VRHDELVPDDRWLEIVYKLPSPMRFAAECIGAVFTFHLEERTATIHLPAQPSDASALHNSVLVSPSGGRRQSVLDALEERTQSETHLE
jgi:hypothetical protein